MAWARGVIDIAGPFLFLGAELSYARGIQAAQCFGCLERR